MPRIKLTKEAIRRLPAPDPSGRQVLFWDTEQRGFGLLVSGRTNVKSYVVQREVNGRTRRVTLGTVAEFEATGRTLEDARHEAAEMVLEMRKGVDPKARRGPEANVTLEAIVRARGKASYEGSIRRWLDDWLDRPLRDITAEMVDKRFRDIKDEVAQRGKRRVLNASSEPGAATANAVMKALRTVWNFAMDEEVPELPSNPVSRLKRRWFTVPPRESHVSGDQLPAFYKAVLAMPSRTMRDYILLLLFTGLRRNEAAGLKWADIDFAQRIIRLPARRTKAKRKLDLPMSDFVHDLLVARRSLGTEGAFVFPADSRTGHLQEPKKALREVGQVCGVHVSPHDLRRTWITVASRCRIAPMELKGLVNHAIGGDVTEGYAQLSAADLADAAQLVANRLKALCGVPTIEGGKVAQFRT